MRNPGWRCSGCVQRRRRRGSGSWRGEEVVEVGAWFYESNYLVNVPAKHCQRHW